MRISLEGSHMRLKQTSLIIAFSLMISIGGTASAQDYKTQLFAGYSMYGAARQGAKAYNGWTISLARGLSPGAADPTGQIRWFGIAGQVSGNYRLGGNIHSFLVGPEFSLGDATLRIFSDVLFGASRVSSGFNGLGQGDTGLSIEFDTGIEIGSLRLFEFGYQYSRFPGISRNGIRLAAGLVYRFQR
jgi:hypothetical protein